MAEFSCGLHLQNIGSHDTKAEDLRSFAPKMTETELFLFSPVNFSEIRYYSQIALFVDFLKCGNTVPGLHMYT